MKKSKGIDYGCLWGIIQEIRIKNKITSIWILKLVYQGVTMHACTNGSKDYFISWIDMIIT